MIENSIRLPEENSQGRAIEKQIGWAPEMTVKRKEANCQLDTSMGFASSYLITSTSRMVVTKSTLIVKALQLKGVEASTQELVLRRTRVPVSLVLLCLQSSVHLLYNARVTFPWSQACWDNHAHGPESMYAASYRHLSSNFPLIEMQWQWMYSPSPIILK